MESLRITYEGPEKMHTFRALVGFCYLCAVLSLSVYVSMSEMLCFTILLVFLSSTPCVSVDISASGFWANQGRSLRQAPFFGLE